LQIDRFVKWLWHAVCVLCLTAAPAIGAPQIAVVEAKHDFGAAQTGSRVSHTFSLRNSGDAELRIEKVEPACGCTVAELERKTLAPGSAVPLNVTLSLKGRRGSLRKSVVIHSNDPETPKLVLWMNGTATSPVAATPAKVFFGQVDPAEQATRTVDITAEDGSPLRIERVKIVPRGAGASSEDAKRRVAAQWSHELKPVVAGSTYRVSVRLAPGKKLGARKATLRVYTNHESLPVLRVPLSAVVAGELSYVPEKILLMDRGGKPVTRYVVVSRGQAAKKDAPFKITGVQTPSADIKAEVQAVGKHGYRVRLSDVVAEPSLDGEPLRITTDVESMPEIVIPFEVEQGAEPEEAVTTTRKGAGP